MTIAALVTVSCYGVLKNFSPDFQYFSDYLTGTKNFTIQQVTQEIYPVSSYSNIFVMLIVLLVTDLLQYKPIIVIGSGALICSKSMIYLGETKLQMQLAEVFYAVSKASNLGYSTYIYTQIAKDKYQFGATLVQVSPKLGAMMSSLIGQILLFFQLASLKNLLQINLCALFFGFLLTLSLPCAKQQTNNDENATVSTTQQESFDHITVKFMNQVKKLWKEFKSTFSNAYLLKWVVWMVMSTALSDMVSECYAQALWSEVSGEQNIYNGLADELYLVFSISGCYIAGKLAVDWDTVGDLLLGLISIVEGVFVLVSSYSTTLSQAYVCYAFYSASYDWCMVLYRAEMARHLENFGLIFGIDQFLAIIVQSVLTLLLTSNYGLALPIRHQFSVVGCCFVLLGTVVIMKMIFHHCGKSRGSIKIKC